MQMKWTPLIMSAKDRRALILGAGTVTLLIGARLCPGLTEAMRTSKLSAAETIADADRAEHAAALLPALRHSLADGTARLAALDSAILDGDSPSSAAATLAELVADIASQSGITLGTVDLGQSMEASDSIGPTDLRTVAVRATGSGSLEAIVQMISTLELGFPLLVVRKLSLTRQGGSTSGGLESLQVALTIEGLARDTSSTQGSPR
jgi:hypothetical protein